MKINDLTVEANQREFLETRYKQGDELMPTCLITDNKGQVRAFAMPFTNADEKAFCVLTLRALIAKLKAKEYAFVAQVRMGHLNGIAPSEQADSEEGVMFNVKKPTSSDDTLWQLTRNESGLREPIAPMKFNNAGGEFSDLFDIIPFTSLNSTKKRKVEKAVKQLIKSDPLITGLAL